MLLEVQHFKFKPYDTHLILILTFPPFSSAGHSAAVYYRYSPQSQGRLAARRSLESRPARYEIQRIWKRGRGDARDTRGSCLLPLPCLLFYSPPNSHACHRPSQYVEQKEDFVSRKVLLQSRKKGLRTDALALGSQGFIFAPK